MPFCNKCGTELKDGAKFCAGCGAPAGAGASAVNNLAGNTPGLYKSSPKVKSHNSLVGILIIMGIALCASLPFHYVIGYGSSGIMVFPKKGLTLENTFITEETVDNIIERYNSANLMERLQMKGDPIIQKLKEKGIIVEKDYE